MISHLIFVVCTVMVLVHHRASAQWSFDQAGLGGAWGQSNFGWRGSGGWGGIQQRGSSNFQTCIGKNINGDELRVTFSQGNNDNFWGNRFSSQWGNTGRPRLSVVLSSGQSQSTLFGQYRLVVFTGSRVEEGCNSRALGEILSDRNRAWWGQPRTPRGVIGTAISIAQGQTATSSEDLEGITMEELRGRGLALCRMDQIASTCVGVIPLCCKIGYDSQEATTPFAVQGQLFNQGLGMQNQGMMGGLNQGLGMGLNQGLNQGFGGGLSQGMNQGGLAQGVNQGLAQSLSTGISGGLGQNTNNPGAQGLSF